MPDCLTGPSILALVADKTVPTFEERLALCSFLRTVRIWKITGFLSRTVEEQAAWELKCDEAIAQLETLVR